MCIMYYHVRRLISLIIKPPVLLNLHRTHGAPNAWVKDFYAVGDGHPRAVEGAFQNNGSGVCWDIFLVNLVNRLGNPGKYCWKTCF